MNKQVQKEFDKIVSLEQFKNMTYGDYIYTIKSIEKNLNEKFFERMALKRTKHNLYNKIAEEKYDRTINKIYSKTTQFLKNNPDYISKFKNICENCLAHKSNNFLEFSNMSVSCFSTRIYNKNKYCQICTNHDVIRNYEKILILLKKIFIPEIATIINDYTKYEPSFYKYLF